MASVREASGRSSLSSSEPAAQFMANITHWELGVEREKIERMMGHKGTSVTEVHYDKPEAEMLAKTIAVAYKAHPYANNWDELGRK